MSFCPGNYLNNIETNVYLFVFVVSSITDGVVVLGAAAVVARIICL